MIDHGKWAVEQYSKLNESGKNSVRELFSWRTKSGVMLQIKIDSVFIPMIENGMKSWEEMAIREIIGKLPEDWKP